MGTSRDAILARFAKKSPATASSGPHTTVGTVTGTVAGTTTHPASSAPTTDNPFADDDDVDGNHEVIGSSANTPPSAALAAGAQVQFEPSPPHSVAPLGNHEFGGGEDAMLSSPPAPVVTPPRPPPLMTESPPSTAPPAPPASFVAAAGAVLYEDDGLAWMRGGARSAPSALLAGESSSTVEAKAAEVQQDVAKALRGLFL